jgi:pilus assembly protein Flp/PilA
MSKVLAFLKDDSGATAIEYGLIAAGISVVIIATVNTIGSTLNTNFTSISTQLSNISLWLAGSEGAAVSAASSGSGGERRREAVF